MQEGREPDDSHSPGSPDVLRRRYHDSRRVNQPPHGEPMMPNFTIPHVSNATILKSSLVTIGLDALARGDWQIVMAVTTLIRNRGWAHA
jgi:hypothetical protein